MAEQNFPAADLKPLIVFAFDGQGGARELSEKETNADDLEPPKGGFIWAHLKRGAPATSQWLADCKLDEFVVDALVASETRPRSTVHGEGALINLRGVNPAPGADPDDLVAVRLWVENGWVVGVWVEPIGGVVDLIEAIRRGHSPKSPGDFVARLALRLADRADPATVELNERVDALEVALIKSGPSPSRGELADVRQTAIGLRRFMFPQRDALIALQDEELPWLKDDDRSRIREAADRVTRLAEELDAIRDRAEVIHDQIMDERAELMNRRMLVLSIVAAIFLPLSLVSGVFGMNVAGMPWLEDASGFWIVCGSMAVLAVVLYVAFKWLKML